MSDRDDRYTANLTREGKQRIFFLNDLFDNVALFLLYIFSASFREGQRSGSDIEWILIPHFGGQSPKTHGLPPPPPHPHSLKLLPICDAVYFLHTIPPPMHTHRHHQTHTHYVGQMKSDDRFVMSVTAHRKPSLLPAVSSHDKWHECNQS